MRVPEDADRDFVAGCFLIRDGEILLIEVPEFGWIQPGGHVEPGETPDEAAIRETKEETGWKVELLSSSEEVDESFDLPKPFDVNLHSIEEDHWHCSFHYLAKPVEKGEPTHSHEYEKSKWFSEEELEEIESPGNVKNAARKAFQVVKEKY